MRVDKWLWTARLFKTRALAAGAVKGGRVHVDGAAVKPSREVGPGDELEITIGTVRRTVIVRGAAERRTSAADPRKAGVGLLDTSPYWRTAVTLCRLASNSERVVADGCVISDELWLSKRTPAWKDKLEPRRCNRTDDHRSVTPRFPYRA